MAARKLWALAAAGAANRSFLNRIPALRGQLGPVASTSLRLAARISKALRAGSPVRTPAELDAADVLLICVPGMPLEPLIDAAFLDAIHWPRKSVLILEGGNVANVASVADDLRSRGAAVGTLATVPGLPDHFVVTGDRPPVRLAKATVHSLGGQALEIPAGRMPIFECALTLTGSLFTPLLEAVVESLRHAGLEQPKAARIADLLLLQSLRSFRRAGRKSWSGPIALADHAAVDAQQKALEQVNPAMAAFFRDAARYGFELYQTFPELTRYDKVRWDEFRQNQSS